VAVAKPPDVVSVILGFNYEAHDAAAYKLNNSSTSTDRYNAPTDQISAKSNNPRRD